MKLNSRLIAVATLIASLRMISAGDITGKITLTGTPPAEKSWGVGKDSDCGKLHPDGKMETRFYVVGKGGELADVFIYIKDGLTGKTFPVSETPAVLDQRGCEYIPYVSGLQVNQKLLVKNSDPLMHNVHPQPASPGNKEQNNAMMPLAKKPLEYQFAAPEVLLKFKCDVHNWMFSYVGVLDHPFYSVSAADGTFKISNVPAGTYTVEAYHRKGGKQTAQVTVEATGSKTANFTFAVPEAK